MLTRYLKLYSERARPPCLAFEVTEYLSQGTWNKKSRDKYNWTSQPKQLALHVYSLDTKGYGYSSYLTGRTLCPWVPDIMSRLSMIWRKGARGTRRDTRGVGYSKRDGSTTKLI